jgi:hypothetical protein
MQTKNKHNEKIRIARKLVGGHIGFTIGNVKTHINLFNNGMWNQRKLEIAVRVARKQGRLPTLANGQDGDGRERRRTADNAIRGHEVMGRVASVPPPPLARPLLYSRGSVGDRSTYGSAWRCPTTASFKLTLAWDLSEEPP